MCINNEDDSVVVLAAKRGNVEIVTLIASDALKPHEQQTQ